MSITGNIIVNESGTATHIENYKIVILGDQFVGKTSILNKYKYETVEDGYAVLYFIKN
jgi:GTPase SAR1 family protein